MQVCTLLHTDNHASTPPLSFLQAGCLSCRPTNSVKALKAIIEKIYKHDTTVNGTVPMLVGSSLVSGCVVVRHAGDESSACNWQTSLTSSKTARSLRNSATEHRSCDDNQRNITNLFIMHTNEILAANVPTHFASAQLSYCISILSADFHEKLGWTVILPNLLSVPVQNPQVRCPSRHPTNSVK